MAGVPAELPKAKDDVKEHKLHCRMACVPADSPKTEDDNDYDFKKLKDRVLAETSKAEDDDLKEHRRHSRMAGVPADSPKTEDDNLKEHRKIHERKAGVPAKSPKTIIQDYDFKEDHLTCLEMIYEPLLFVTNKISCLGKTRVLAESSKTEDNDHKELCINCFVTDERWSILSKELEKNVNDDLKQWAVREASERACDSDFERFMLHHCSEDQLEPVVRQLTERRMWLSVESVLKKKDISDTLRERLVSYIIDIISGLSVLTMKSRRDQNLWNLLGGIIKITSDTIRKRIIDLAASKANPSDIEEFLVPNCTRDEFERILPSLVQRFVTLELWSILSKELGKNVNDDLKQWAVREASEKASDSDFERYMLHHCSEDQLEPVVWNLTKRRMWLSVESVFKKRDITDTLREQLVSYAINDVRGLSVLDMESRSDQNLFNLLCGILNTVSDTMRKRIIDLAALKANPSDIDEFLVPNCTRDEFERILPSLVQRFVRGELWSILSKELGKNVNNGLKQWAVREASKRASDSDFERFMLHHCSDDLLEPVVRQLTKRHMWLSVESVLKKRDISNTLRERFISNIIAMNVRSHQKFWYLLGGILNTVSDKMRKMIIDRAASEANPSDIEDFFVPKCTRDEFERILPSLITHNRWQTVGKILHALDNIIQRQWIVDEAIHNAGDNDFADYILPSMKDSEQKTALYHLLLRGHTISIARMLHYETHPQSQTAEERKNVTFKVAEENLLESDLLPDNTKNAKNTKTYLAPYYSSSTPVLYVTHDVYKADEQDVEHLTELKRYEDVRRRSLSIPDKCVGSVKCFSESVCPDVPAKIYEQCYEMIMASTTSYTFNTLVSFISGNRQEQRAVLALLLLKHDWQEVVDNLMSHFSIKHYKLAVEVAMHRGDENFVFSRLHSPSEDYEMMLPCILMRHMWKMFETILSTFCRKHSDLPNWIKERKLGKITLVFLALRQIAVLERDLYKRAVLLKLRDFNTKYILHKDTGASIIRWATNYISITHFEKVCLLSCNGEELRYYAETRCLTPELQSLRESCNIISEALEQFSKQYNSKTEAQESYGSDAMLQKIPPECLALTDCTDRQLTYVLIELVKRRLWKYIGRVLRLLKNTDTIQIKAILRDFFLYTEETNLKDYVLELDGNNPLERLRLIQKNILVPVMVDLALRGEWQIVNKVFNCIEPSERKSLLKEISFKIPIGDIIKRGIETKNIQCFIKLVTPERGEDKGFKSYEDETCFTTLLCPHWQTHKIFTKDGGVLQTANSDVRLEVPENAICQDQDMAVFGAVSIDLSYIHKQLGMTERESIITPLAEYMTTLVEGFRKPVSIYLPHFLGPEFGVNDVILYEIGSGEMPIRKIKYVTFDQREGKDVWFELTETHIVVHCLHFTAYVCSTCKWISSPIVLRLYGEMEDIFDEVKGVDTDKAIKVQKLVRLNLYAWDRRFTVRDFEQNLTKYDRKDTALGLKMLGQTLADPELYDLGAEMVQENNALWRHKDYCESYQLENLALVQSCKCKYIDESTSLPVAFNFILTSLPGRPPESFSCSIKVGLVRKETTTDNVSEHHGFENHPKPCYLSVENLRVQNEGRQIQSPAQDLSSLHDAGNAMAGLRINDVPSALPSPESARNHCQGDTAGSVDGRMEPRSQACAAAVIAQGGLACPMTSITVTKTVTNNILSLNLDQSFTTNNQNNVVDRSSTYNIKNNRDLYSAADMVNSYAEQPSSGFDGQTTN